MTRCFYSQVLYAKPSEISILNKPTGLVVSGGSSKKVPNSFVSVSEQFIRSVERMVSVVLVPTKLMDISLSTECHQLSPLIIPEIAGSNLYEIFVLVKKFKDKLLGINSAIANDEDLGTFLTTGTFEIDDTIYSFGSSSPATCLVGNHNSSSTAQVDSGIWSSGSLGESSSSSGSSNGSTPAESVTGLAGHSNGSCCSSFSGSELDYDQGIQFSANPICTSSMSPASSATRPAQASCVVRKSLHSAKSLCAFLVDLSSVTKFIMDRYLQELNCEYSE